MREIKTEVRTKTTQETVYTVPCTRCGKILEASCKEALPEMCRECKIVIKQEGVSRIVDWLIGAVIVDVKGIGLDDPITAESLIVKSKDGKLIKLGSSICDYDESFITIIEDAEIEEAVNRCYEHCTEYVGSFDNRSDGIEQFNLLVELLKAGDITPDEARECLIATKELKSLEITKGDDEYGDCIREGNYHYI